MKIQRLFITLSVITLMSCGGGGTSSQTSATETTAVDESATVDSITVAIDEMKSDLQSETEATVQEIDSLLNGI